MTEHNVQLKDRVWKTSTFAPPDAKRPRCRAVISLDGVHGNMVEDETDYIDWLIVIAYEAEE